MCSQPPVDREDDDRLLQLRAAVELIDRDEAQLGITGGEPTLLGDGLFDLLRSCTHHLPNTHLHVLTNGRLFSKESLVRAASSACTKVTWGIPLYSDTPEIHDFVVQRRGAFAETMAGLLNLGRSGQSIELRVVLQRAVVPRVRQLAHFIARNLTFVDHVAWMGLEPMGFARGNWNTIWIEPEEYVEALEDAIHVLSTHGMTTSIYNVPLCVLPSSLWPYARQSISDWKNDYRKECEGCAVRAECCGFFSSVQQQHLPRGIKPIPSSPWTRREEEHA
jgi:His-Xaa-Ser system radical SAM maturase HxsC